MLKRLHLPLKARRNQQLNHDHLKIWKVSKLGSSCAHWKRTRNEATVFLLNGVWISECSQCILLVFLHVDNIYIYMNESTVSSIFDLVTYVSRNTVRAHCPK